MVANPDGSIVVGLDGRLVRYTATGTPDLTFGAAGFAQITAGGVYQLLPAAAGGVLVVSHDDAVPGAFQVQRIAADGTVDRALGASDACCDVPFGGGASSEIDSLRRRALRRSEPLRDRATATSFTSGDPLLPPLEQNNFAYGSVIARPDGSYLVIGGVTLSRPTSDLETGTGFSIFDFAAAALTPSFAPDTTFGAPATPLHATLRLATQQAATVRRLHRVRVKLRLSAPGLGQVLINAAGHVVAQSVLPVLTARQTTLPVALTAYGYQLLRRHPHIKLRAGIRARDLLTDTIAATATGRLK